MRGKLLSRDSGGFQQMNVRNLGKSAPGRPRHVIAIVVPLMSAFADGIPT